MIRISTNMPNDDMQYHARIREWRMNSVQNSIAEQTRVGNLRDDPVAAAHSVRYESRLVRMERYVRNIGTLRSDIRIAEDYLKEANAILHRSRELALQGANDTYSKEQKQMMAFELNELLNELIDTANARGPEGTALFSGDRTDSLPFRVLSGNVPGARGHVVTEVLYTGALAQNRTEVSDGSFIPGSIAGSEVFWAEQQEVLSDVNAVEYVVQQDSAILIDGVRIEVRTGDNVYAVVAKINDSAAAVRASLDPVSNSLTLRTSYPHQMWIEDEGEGTVLRDLGILSGFGRPPNNLAPEARVSGGSLFDMLIFLRDRLLQGETVDIGGAALKGLDLAQSNLLASVAELGAQNERIDLVEGRLDYETPEVVRRNSEAVDIDMTEAVTNLKMLEYTHRAALQTAARIIQPTLLDFLR
jgi:flagellar hook-associated protein 3 FlgL